MDEVLVNVTKLVPFRIVEVKVLVETEVTVEVIVLGLTVLVFVPMSAV